MKDTATNLGRLFRVALFNSVVGIKKQHLLPW